MTAATNQDVETQFLRVSSHGSKTIKCCTDQDQITRETFNNVTHLQVVDLGTFNWPLLLLTQSTSVVWSQSKQSLPSEPHGIYHQTQSTSVVWSQSKQSLPSQPHGIYICCVKPVKAEFTKWTSWHLPSNFSTRHSSTTWNTVCILSHEQQMSSKVCRHMSTYCIWWL